MTSIQAGIAPRLKAKAGFTLTEVTIIVAIIGFLTMVAVPNFLNWNRKYQLKDAVATLHGNIGLARMSAINQSTTVTVTVTQTSAAAPVTVTFRTAAGADVIPPMTMDLEVDLTNTNNATVGAGVSSPQNVQLTPMGMRKD